MALKSLYSNETSFKDITLRLDGVKVTTLQSVNFYKNVEKEPVYGENIYPLGISQGYYSYGGEITVNQSEFETFSPILYDLLDVDTFAITAVMNLQGRHPTIYQATNVGFTEWNLSRQQADYYGMVNLPFICEKISVTGGKLIERIEENF